MFDDAGAPSVTAPTVSLTHSLEDFQSDEQRLVLDTVAQIRKCRLEAILPLPQIVVCGNQSSGKSSVLEALTEVPFPRNDNLCTRFATEITLRRGPVDSLRLSIIPDENRGAAEKATINAFSATIADFAAWPDVMSKAATVLGIHPSACSDGAGVSNKLTHSRSFRSSFWATRLFKNCRLVISTFLYALTTHCHFSSSCVPASESCPRAVTRKDSEGDKEDLMVPRKHLGMLTEAMWGMIGELHETSSGTPAEEAKNTTVLEAIQNSELFRDAFFELPEKYHSALRGVPQFIENMEAAPLVPSSAETPYTQPGVGLLEYAIDDFDGEQVFLLDGYTPIIEEWARPLQHAGVIETNTQVETIDWSSSPIKLHTSSGTYKTKIVVLSIPLGVLKARYNSLFQPELPKPKQEAIASLGFGTLDKIFLVYSQPWWAEEPYSSFFRSGKRANTTSPYSFMGFTHDLSGLSISPDRPAEPGPRILSFINLHALTGYPVLGVFVSCSNATTIEKMSDGEAGHLAHSNFASWLPAHPPAPPNPEAVHVTR